MTGMGNPPKGFGDLCGEYLANDAATPGVETQVVTWSDRYGFSADVAAIARAWGESPAEVSRELNRNTALARLLRKLLLGDGEKYSADDLAHSIELRVRAEESLVGKTLWPRVEEIMRNEHPNWAASGSNDQESRSNSLKTMATRAKRKRAQRLSALFG